MQSDNPLIKLYEDRFFMLLITKKAKRSTIMSSIEKIIPGKLYWYRENCYNIILNFNKIILGEEERAVVFISLSFSDYVKEFVEKYGNNKGIIYGLTDFNMVVFEMTKFGPQ